MANTETIWNVQVYDTQEHTLQTQAFRTEASVIECVKDVKRQLDEQGDFTYQPAPNGEAYSFDALQHDEDLDEPRRISVDVYKVYLND